MDDFKGFRTSVGEVTADVVGTARELHSEVESEDVTELLQSRDKTLTNEELLLMAKKRKSFLETKPTHGKDAVKFVKTTIKDLEYYIL